MTCSPRAMGRGFADLEEPGSHLQFQVQKRRADSAASWRHKRTRSVCGCLPNLSVLDQGGACGAAGPASAPGSALGRPARRTPGHAHMAHRSRFPNTAGHGICANMPFRLYRPAHRSLRQRPPSDCGGSRPRLARDPGDHSPRICSYRILARLDRHRNKMCICSIMFAVSRGVQLITGLSSPSTKPHKRLMDNTIKKIMYGSYHLYQFLGLGRLRNPTPKIISDTSHSSFL